MKILFAVSILLYERLPGKPFLLVFVVAFAFIGPWEALIWIPAAVCAGSLRWQWRLGSNPEQRSSCSVCGQGGRHSEVSKANSLPFPKFCLLVKARSVSAPSPLQSQPDPCNKLPGKREENEVKCFEIWLSSRSVQGYLLERAGLH